MFQCYKWFWFCLPLNCYMFTLHLVHYTLLLRPTCWQSSNTNARPWAVTFSLALDPTFGIHSHKTLDTAQPCHLLKPNWKPSSSHSISAPANISTQFLLQSLHVCVCVCFHILPYGNCLGRTVHNKLMYIYIHISCTHQHPEHSPSDIYIVHYY